MAPNRKPLPEDPSDDLPNPKEVERIGELVDLGNKLNIPYIDLLDVDENRFDRQKKQAERE
jgi:hypothetical protein